jgi:hypothetical protein
MLSVPQHSNLIRFWRETDRRYYLKIKWDILNGAGLPIHYLTPPGWQSQWGTSFLRLSGTHWFFIPTILGRCRVNYFGIEDTYVLLILSYRKIKRSDYKYSRHFIMFGIVVILFVLYFLYLPHGLFILFWILRAIFLKRKYFDINVVFSRPLWLSAYLLGLLRVCRAHTLLSHRSCLCWASRILFKIYINILYNKYRYRLRSMTTSPIKLKIRCIK